MDWRFDFLLFKERRNYVAEALYQAFNGKLDHCTYKIEVYHYGLLQYMLPNSR